jgi:hypothetical protein
MKHTGMCDPNERAAQRFIGEPLRQFAGRQAFDEVLLQREVKPKRVAFDEHEAG